MASAPDLPDCGDAIDEGTFEQILEMDDDDKREFSLNIVLDFFQQARDTFEKLQTAIETGDLETLSADGHFLKGSSATLGLTKVSNSCAKIQHLGSKKTEDGESDITAEGALQRIKQIFPVLKADYQDAETRLRAFYKPFMPEET